MDETMLKRLWPVALAGVLILQACSGEEGLSCLEDRRYASSRSVPPLRIPDDLSPPDESEVLVIPQTGADRRSEPPPGRNCLEAPPDFAEPVGQG
jgi:uncharacterized lipoprotein